MDGWLGGVLAVRPVSDLLTEPPDSFYAGTTVKLCCSYADYPASSGWSLKLYLAGPSIANFTGVASSAAFNFTLPATDTAALKPGTYVWQALASKSGETYVADEGRLEVLPNIVSARAGDLQTWEERTLAVVEAALENRLSADMEAYQIAGRAVTKIRSAELLELRARLRHEVWMQKHPGHIQPDIRVRFGRVHDEEGAM